MRPARLGTLWATLVALLAVALLQPQGAPSVQAQERTAPASAGATQPNIFFYNLDDLRDAVPQGVDPLQYMPKVRRWMAAGTRYTKTFVANPSCCPSRASVMTGRYPHNNGVRRQEDGPGLDGPHTMACYLRSAGYATHHVGKFLVSWPGAQRPPCFDRSTVIGGGYVDVDVRVDGRAVTTAPGYSTTFLGVRGRQYVREGLASGKPFLLYEAPQAPHWVSVENPDGTIGRRAVPDARYADADVGTCAGPAESDRSDKPAYLRELALHGTAAAQKMCASQLRAIMTADDEFGATLRLLRKRRVLADTLVILSSDNGYLWGEHGRTEKFLPYEPSVRVPLLVRWPGHVPAGTDAARTVSYLDLLPTMMAAAGTAVPTGAPPLDGESLLSPSRRTVMFAEYFQDCANSCVIPSWRMVRTGTVKYVQVYGPQGGVTFREYYRLSTDPTESTNLLADGNAANDPPAAELATLAAHIEAFTACRGAACVR